VVSLVRRTALAVFLATAAVVPVHADSGAGSYLAGRQAIYESDYKAAEEYYSKALIFDPGNTKLKESVLLARVALGDVERALPIAEDMEANEQPNQAARMVVSAKLVSDGKFDELLARDPENQGVGPLVDGLMTAWAHLGKGEMTKAMAQFDEVAQQDGLREFALYHKALALASVGDFEGAEAIFAADDSIVARFSRRAALARVEVLSQLNRNDEALQFLENVFAAGSDPSIESYVDTLSAGGTLPFTHVGSATEGVAEVFFSVGAALNTEAAHDYVLLYARIATYLRPDHIDAIC